MNDLIRRLRRRALRTLEGWRLTVTHDIPSAIASARHSIEKSPRRLGRSIASSWQNRPRISELLHSQKQALQRGTRGVGEEVGTQVEDVLQEVSKFSPQRVLRVLLGLPRALVMFVIGSLGEILATFLKVWRWWSRLFRRLHPAMKVAISILLVAILVSAYFSRTLWRGLKSWRAEHLFAESQLLREEGELLEAFEKGRAAYFLDAEDPAIIRYMTELSREFNSPTAVFWGERLAAVAGEDTDALLDVVELALDYRNLELSLPYLGLLRQRIPENERLQVAEVRMLVEQGRRQRAFQRAEALLDEGLDDTFLHETYAALGLRLQNEERRSEVIDHILSESRRDDSVGISMLKARLSMPELQDSERNALVAQLFSHPEVEDLDLLIAASYKIRNGLATWDELSGMLLDRFNPRENKDRRIIADWMLREQLWEPALQLFDEKAAIADDSVCRLWLMARINAGQAVEVEAFLRSVGKAGLAVSTGIFRFLRALTFYNMGRIDDYNHQVFLAISASVPRDWAFIEGELQKLQDIENQLIFYRFVAADRRFATIGYRRLFSYHYLNAETESIMQLLGEAELALFRNEPPTAAFVGYLQLLHGHDPSAIRRELETIATSERSDAFTRFVLAMVYTRLGNSTGAFNLVKNDLERLSSESPAIAHLIAAQIQLDAQNWRAAQRNLQSAAGRVFLPAEKQWSREIQTGIDRLAL